MEKYLKRGKETAEKIKKTIMEIKKTAMEISKEVSFHASERGENMAYQKIDTRITELHPRNKKSRQYG